jgi:hypothetical protein
MRNLTEKEVEDILTEKNPFECGGIIYNPNTKGFNPIIVEKGKVNIISNVVITIEATSIGVE